MTLDADGLPVTPAPETVYPEKQTETCPDCGKEYGIGEWWVCPHGRPNYGWHFSQGHNDARREAFYAKKAADPFGSD